MVTVVNHHLLAKALDYYEGLGYTRVELPWMVPLEFCRMTCDLQEGDCARMSDRCLVGSAEQAFLFCDSLKLLDPGRYVGLTPCFRQGDDTSPYHQETFYKVELYRTDSTTHDSFRAMIADAHAFFSDSLVWDFERSELEVVESEQEDGWFRSIQLYQWDTTDIRLNGIEIGSYGKRQSGKHIWLFGTGLAEPRFTMASALSRERGDVLAPVLTQSR